MNICFLCNEYPPYRNGGIGTFTKELSEGLTRKGNTVFVVGYYDNIKTDESSIIKGVNIYKLTTPFKSGVLARIKLFLKITKIESEYGIDILESQENSGLIAFWPRRKFKVLIRLHGSVVYFKKETNEWSLKDYFWLFIEKSGLKRSSRIVSVSKYTASKTKKYFSLKDNITVVYNSAPFPKEMKCNYELHHGLKAIFAGSLITKKGFMALAVAWNKFNLEYPDSTIVIAGKNNFGQLDEFLSLIENKSSVKYLGVLEKADLILYYKKLDVAIFPSFVEAFSLSPMEAMATGIPVIYTELCSGQELINHGENGLLVNPFKPSTIYNNLVKIQLMQSKERQLLGMSGRDTIISDFNFLEKIDENISIYQSLLVSK